ncbi:MAG: energy-coupling factor transporter transmembrane protein EcfT [Desulfovibrio sp.]|nr:energy-coupling factor transporter transmembrane protein EcfT [Desulfovibrio sp.]
MFDQPFVHDCPIQAIDPRVRLVLAGLIAVCFASLQQPTSCMLALALGACLLASACPPFIPLARRFAAVNCFVLFFWCVIPFTVPGETFTVFNLIPVSARGVRLALLTTLKANAVFFVFQALAATMQPSTAGYALQSLGCPHKLIFLFLFTGRYVHLLAEEWQTLNVAAHLRGFMPRTSMHAWRTLACLLGLLLVRSYNRSLRVCEAMRLRAFSGRFTTVTVFRARHVDAVFALVVLLCITGIALTESGVFYG